MTVSDTKRKATFNLSSSVLAALGEAMAAHAAPSKNALVQRALVRELEELRRQARKIRWEEGARDTLLLKDIQDAETAFQTSDAETAGSTD